MTSSGEDLRRAIARLFHRPAQDRKKETGQPQFPKAFPKIAVSGLVQAQSLLRLDLDQAKRSWLFLACWFYYHGSDILISNHSFCANDFCRSYHIMRFFDRLSSLCSQNLPRRYRPAPRKNAPGCAIPFQILEKRVSVKWNVSAQSHSHWRCG